MLADQHDGAVAPGRVTAASDNARWAAGVEGNEKADSRGCAIGEAFVEAKKAFATVRATLALRGFELHAVGDGDAGMMFLVQRWGQSRTLASLADVRVFARQVRAMPC